MGTETQQIANTIMDQMGGQGRIALMIGARQFALVENGIRIKFPNRSRSRANCVVVTLDRESDTYNVEFWRVSDRCPWNDKKLESYDGIYCDQLIDLFENNTGLYLTLTPRS